MAAESPQPCAPHPPPAKQPSWPHLANTSATAFSLSPTHLLNSSGPLTWRAWQDGSWQLGIDPGHPREGLPCLYFSTLICPPPTTTTTHTHSHTHRHVHSSPTRS